MIPSAAPAIDLHVPFPSESEDDSPLNVLVRPVWIRSRYERFIVVAHDSQVADADIAPTTLFVTTDWLAWRRLIRRRAHSLHFESALGHWPEGDQCPPDHLLRGTEWMYVDGRDATLFRGVSLGKLFNWEVAASRHAAFRVFHALDRLASELRPKQIEFIDLRGEYDLITDEAKKIIVRGVAARHGATFVERSANTDTSGYPFPHVRFDRETPPPSLVRRLFRAIFEAVVHATCSARDALSGHGLRVLVFQNPLLTRGLLDAAPPGVQPMVLVRHHPKTPRFVLSCLKKGIFLVRLPWARLASDDLKALRNMRRTLAEAWTEPAATIEDAATRTFILTHILADGPLETAATNVKRFARLIARARPDRLLIGDSENGTCRLLLEICCGRGIPVDELFNGIFLSDQRTDARSGDAYRPPLLNRALSWGSHAEQWLHRIGSPVPTCRVGCPVVDILLQRPPLPLRSGTKRALVLPLHVERGDVRGIESQVFATLVKVIRVLRNEGFQVRVKVHPGFHDLGYYDELLREHSLDAEAVQDGTLPDHVGWADVVVGPIASNALLETLVMGRAYVPMRLNPTSMDIRLIHPVPVADTIEDMMALVRQGGVDREQTFRLLSDYDPVHPAGERVWAAMIGARSSAPVAL